MLNLYQGFYKNIGPLKNKSYLINYVKKNILIKAPIGTGKSFLFFDAPIFALYKVSDRVIINKDSKSAEIHLLFSIDERFFLIIRKIKQTKSGKDSVKTMLYEIIVNKHFLDYLDKFTEIVQDKEKGILDLLKSNNISLNDLTSDFKQESVLQQALNDILPPKEVVLNTIFLFQNSDNVFEMTPSNRISVFKKVFGILGIDEAKKIIDEKKISIYGELKARLDKSVYIQRIVDVLQDIRSLSFDFIKIGQLHDFLKDLDLLSVDNFNIDKAVLLKIGLDEYFNTIKNKLNTINKFKTDLDGVKEKKEHIENELKKLNEMLISLDQKIIEFTKIKEQKRKLEKEQNDNLIKINFINKKYSNIHQKYEQFILIDTKLKNLKLQASELENSIKNLLKKKKELVNDVNNINLDKINGLQTSIKELQQRLEDLMDLDYKSFKFENVEVSNLQQLKELIQKVEFEGKTYSQQIKDLQSQLNEIENSLNSLMLTNQEKTEFFCKEINSMCPFIKEIQLKFNKSIKLIENQKEKLLLQKARIKDKLEKYTIKREYLVNWWKSNNITNVKKKLGEIEEVKQKINDSTSLLIKYQQQQEALNQKEGQVKQIESEIFNKQKQLDNINNEIEGLKNSLDIQVKEDYMEYLQLKEENEKILSKLNFIVNKLNDLLVVENEKKQLLENIKNYEKDKELLINELETKNKKLKELKDQEKKLISDEKKLIKLKELIGIYNNIILDYNKNKQKIVEIKRRYKILKELSNIFGRELVIYVFSDYLQSLEELINYFISDVVNFTLYIRLDSKGENLDIFVEDELGRRPISSLSGGQKTALRIGWILAISKLQNNKMLFLDETINNFDQNTIGILAEKIKTFIKEQNMKFYMVTHSEILQQINIWDEVINLKL